MDPVAGDLQAITTLQHALNWAGVGQALRDALFVQTGEIALIREVCLMPYADWERAIRAVQVPAQDEADRAILPVEDRSLVVSPQGVSTEIAG